MTSIVTVGRHERKLVFQEASSVRAREVQSDQAEEGVGVHHGDWGFGVTFRKQA